MKQWPFPVSLRLHDSAAFKAVFDKVDKKFFSKGLLVLVKKSTQPEPRLGLVVSKKNVSLSCRRNTIKRLIRESFRIHQQKLPGLDIVVLVRREIAEVDRELLWQGLNQLWQSVSVARIKSV